MNAGMDGYSVSQDGEKYYGIGLNIKGKIKNRSHENNEISYSHALKALTYVVCDSLPTGDMMNVVLTEDE